VLESFFDKEEEGLLRLLSFELEHLDKAMLWEERIMQAVNMGKAEFTCK